MGKCGDNCVNLHQVIDMQQDDFRLASFGHHTGEHPRSEQLS